MQCQATETVAVALKVHYIIVYYYNIFKVSVVINVH